MKKNIRHEVFLGALLHDIGKFYQRSDLSLRDSQNLSSQAKNILDYICPVDHRGKPGYQHVIWTADFFNKISAKIKHLSMEVGDWDMEKELDDNLVNLSIYHHRPNTVLQRLIQLADWWSSGLDRNKSYKEMTSSNYSDFRDVRLESVFNSLNTEKGKNAESGYFMQLQAVSLEESSIFPEKDTVLKKEYGPLWESFFKEFEQIPTDPDSRSVEAFSETLLFLLKKYLSVVPASTMRGEIPDTTLYDHLKSTAAIAQSLFDYFHEKHPEKLADEDFIPNSFFDLDKNPDVQPPLLLFCGDINGIQKFIYNIASSKAGKSLKGRSFYVQLLTETIVQRIIDDCGVSLAHVVYSSGGKFFVILPNTDYVVNAVKRLRKEIESNIFDIHHGELYVCMDFVEFGYNNRVKVFYKGKNEHSNYTTMHANNLGPVWKELFDKINIQKKSKHKDLLIERFSDLFEPPMGVLMTPNVCAVTGIELADKDKKTLKKFGADDVVVSNTVYEQTRIGHVLKDADFFITFREIGERSYEAWKEKSIQPLNLKVHHYLFDESELTGDQSEFRFISSADVARVRRFNNTQFNQINKLKGKHSSYGFAFYGGNKQAIKEGSNEYKTFEELAGDKESGFKRLGVLRMDVDNLGQLFIEGIDEERKNLSVYSTLSNQLDLFFSGYINTIRNSEKFKDHVNILYSGGDDVFAIGRWDLIIEFAEHLRNDFRKFVCNREDISISAGIALVGSKFPVFKAAQLAGEAEHKAKQFGFSADNNRPAGKNALNLFGENIQWGDEFNFVKSFAEQLYIWLKSGVVSKSLLQRFFVFRKIKDEGKQDWRWLSAYTFARMQKSDARSKDVMEKLKRVFVTGEFSGLALSKDETMNYKFETTRALDLLCVAARWADFKFRD